jgi:hypothetical protein
MTRRLSLSSHVKKAAEAARQAGLPLASVKTPDGYELTFAVAAPSSVTQDGPPKPRIVPDGKSPRVRAAA